MFMLVSALSLAASAAEPADIGGVYLGGALQTQLADDRLGAPLPSLGIRLQLGARAIIDLGGGGGVITDDDRTTRSEENEDGEPVLASVNDAELSGWTASFSGRVLLGLGSGGPVRVFLGPHVAWDSESLEGPYSEDVSDGGVGLVEEEVGDVTASSAGGSVGASLVGLHWLNDRIAVGGLLDLGIYRWADDRYEEVRRENGVTEVSRSDQSTALGLFPRAGISVHMRL